jgi:hypothetical protein
MSRCGRTQHLEAVVTPDTPAGVVAELLAHAKTCAVCRHELGWLQSERALFRQRAGRDEVANLWAGTVARTSAPAQERWSSFLVALAVAASLLVLMGQLLGTSRPPETGRGTDETLESDALMSPSLLFGEEPACSKLPVGVGFQCSQPPLVSIR